jgi:hypothetical protein
MLMTTKSSVSVKPSCARARTQADERPDWALAEAYWGLVEIKTAQLEEYD